VTAQLEALQSRPNSSVQLTAKKATATSEDHDGRIR